MDQVSKFSIVFGDYDRQADLMCGDAIVQTVKSDKPVGEWGDRKQMRELLLFWLERHVGLLRNESDA